MAPKKRYQGSGSIVSRPSTIYTHINTYSKQYPDRFEIIQKTRAAMENHFKPQFPEAYCTEASKAIYHILKNTSVVCGSFEIDDRDERNHCWNYDNATNYFIDITGDQFPALKNYPIVIIHETNHALLHEIGYRIPTEFTKKDFENIFDGEFHILNKPSDATNITLETVYKSDQQLWETFRSRKQSGGKGKRKSRAK